MPAEERGSANAASPGLLWTRPHPMLGGANCKSTQRLQPPRGNDHDACTWLAVPGTKTWTFTQAAACMGAAAARRC